MAFNGKFVEKQADFSSIAIFLDFSTQHLYISFEILFTYFTEFTHKGKLLT